MSNAKNIVDQLLAKGYTKSSIAKKIGRDSSYISQITSGKRPGDKYVDALSALNKGASQATIERQITKAGTQAKVRQASTLYEKNNKGIDVKSKPVQHISKSPKGKQVEGVLKNINKHQGNVGVVVTLKKFQAYDAEKATRGTVNLWSKGTSAKWIRSEMARTGMTFDQLIESQLESLPHVQVAEGVESVTINAVY